MERNAIRQRVTQLLSETLTVPEEEVSDPKTDLRDELGMDSIDFVDLIEVLERELGQAVEQTQLTDVRTIDDVVDLVGALMDKSDATGTSGSGR